LEVAPSEIVGLLGPNGAGKSTLLRILATTLRPDGGRASVGGHDVITAPAAVRRNIGLSFGEERGWYLRISARRNLEFYGALLGWPRDRVRQRATELLGEFGLADDADRPIQQYSSGMRSRLGLARALFSEPAVLLLDEPTTRLDPIAAAEFRVRLQDLAEKGTAILLTTHDLHEASDVPSRIVGLAKGRVAFSCARGPSPHELERLLMSGHRG
jgi:ABC-2 type transport system ATP-binding protein